MNERQISMLNLEYKKGITLVELIVSMAILGIIVITFLNLFVFGYTHVIGAGHKTTASFLAHQAAEIKIAGGATDPNVHVSFNPTTITIQLPAPPAATMTKSGEEISFEVEQNGKVVNVTTFLP